MRGRGYLRNVAATSSNTVVKATNGTPVLVRNVAQGRRGVHAAARARWRAASAIDSIEGTILLRRGENPKDVLHGVHEAVDAHQQATCCRRACASCRSTTARAWSTPR